MTRILSISLALIAFLSAPLTAQADDDSEQELGITESRLTRKAFLPNFGEIAFRPPLAENRGKRGPRIFLIHGIYGGASHLSYRELLKSLDDRGARVFIADLPGTGDSDKRAFEFGHPEGIRKVYTNDLVVDFITEFVDTVIKRPVVLVAESSSTMATLEASTRLHDRVTDVVLLSPTGVNVQSRSPRPEQTAFYNQLLNNEAALNDFYLNALLGEDNIRQIVQPGYFDQGVFRNRLLREYRIGRRVQNQKWISLAFSSGQIFSDFRDIAPRVQTRTLMVFGKNDKGVPVGAGPGDGTILIGEPDREEDFAEIGEVFDFENRFDYLTIDKAAQLIWKELPDLLAEIILSRNRRIRSPAG